MRLIVRHTCGVSGEAGPIWLLSYIYGTSSYQVIVNGYTGKIAGKYPLSWIKITIVSIIGIILLIIFFALFGGK